MLSGKLLQQFMDIKEVPSNVSQDNMRITYNDNFRKIRELISDLYTEVTNSNQIVNNISLLFPNRPDQRLQYILRYDKDADKWRVTEFLGTQNILDDGEAVRIGNKHQHIVYQRIDLTGNAEIIIDRGGELVVLENTLIENISYEIGVTPQISMPYDCEFIGVGYNGTGDNIEVLINGQPVPYDRMIHQNDILTINGNDGLVKLIVQK